jgi:hypothetical protein
VAAAIRQAKNVTRKHQLIGISWRNVSEEEKYQPQPSGAGKAAAISPGQTAYQRTLSLGGIGSISSLCISWKVIEQKQVGRRCSSM